MNDVAESPAKGDLDGDVKIEAGMVKLAGSYALSGVGHAKLEVSVELVKVLEVAASKTKTELDDKLLPYVKALLAALEK